MHSFRIAAIAIAFAALPGLALAQSDTKSTTRIDKRQAEQQKRIDKGVQSGAITEQERKRLEKGQQRVQKMEDKAAADGKVTAQERRRIENAQDRQSKNIAREAHDKQKKK